VWLTGDAGNALVVRVVMEDDGGVRLGDRGEHQVGDRGPMLPTKGQGAHDVDQVLLGGRGHVQIRQRGEIQPHPGQLLGVAGRVEQLSHRHQAYGQLAGLTQLVQAPAGGLVVPRLLPGRFVGQVQRP
jgi:hypothetical protein